MPSRGPRRPILHNACANERIEEMGSVLSDLAGGYETQEGRSKGRERGFADTQPTFASGWAHPQGGGEVPSWDDENAAENMPADKERTKAEKDRAAQMERVSKARVLITESLALHGVSRPDPSVVSANIRAARRARQGGAD